MSFPSGRGGSDHFANIQSLNSIPADFNESTSTDPDLSLFTNTEFFDWDVSEQQPSFDPLSAQVSDAGFNGNYFNDLSFPQPGQSQLPTQDVKTWQPVSSASPTSASSPTATQGPSRRRTDSSARSANPAAASTPIAEEDTGADALNVSAEEDKRRRNTAASARFRVKKKQREQAMEKTAKEMTERVTQLENKVSELEKENKLLKGLLTEKGDGEASRKRLKREEAEA